MFCNICVITDAPYLVRFSVLQRENGGEVLMGDITREVFRRAPDRDPTRI